MKGNEYLKEIYLDDPKSALKFQIEPIHETVTGIEKWLKEKLQGRKAIIGLSGGVDSSVVTYLVEAAVGPENIYGLIMPSNSNTKEDIECA